VAPCARFDEGRINTPGRLVATVLSGAWRSAPPPLEWSPDELTEVAPLLLASGAGALGWWRVRLSALGSTEAAQALHDTYRLYTLKAALYRREIPDTITLIRSAGIEPIMVKGWAIARQYPELGLRPYGDIDLCCRPDQYSAAAAVLTRARGLTFYADLHRGFARLDELSWEEVYARSQVVKIGGLEVRIPGPEDHLRLLCVHFLRHGAWRPLWLCDIAVALETRPPDFDWTRCLGPSRRVADWVACAIGLAHQLLGARVDDTPVAPRAPRLPRWFVPQVLTHWSAPDPSLYPPQSYMGPLLTYIRRRQLKSALQALRRRWADPIAATITVKGPLNDWPRLPFQIGDYGWQVLMRLTKSMRDER
jgi:hypothetical protein